MSDPSYPVFTVFAFSGCCLALIPLPWHLQVWNSGTCLYMFWTFVACLNLGINSIIWHGNTVDHSSVWCDISSRIIVAVAVALPASSLCINRRLYYIASVQTVGVTRAEKRQAILVDLFIGLGIPIAQLLCQYVVSGHRYDIFEDIGCYPYTYNTPPAYPLTVIWPLCIGIVSAIYCVLTLRAFLHRRAQFNRYLSSNPSLTTNRYFRLMALATVELCCTIPISAYGMYLNLAAAPMNPWISWSDTHFHYSKVVKYPAALWHMSHTTVIAFELSRWAAPFCAFVFFAFFGFAAEARKNYKFAFAKVSTFFRLRSKSRPSPISLNDHLSGVKVSPPFPLSFPPSSSSSDTTILDSTISFPPKTARSFQLEKPALDIFKVESSYDDLVSLSVSSTSACNLSECHRAFHPDERV